MDRPPKSLPVQVWPFFLFLDTRRNIDVAAARGGKKVEVACIATSGAICSLFAWNWASATWVLLTCQAYPIDKQLDPCPRPAAPLLPPVAPRVPVAVVLKTSRLSGPFRPSRPKLPQPSPTHPSPVPLSCTCTCASHLWVSDALRPSWAYPSPAWVPTILPTILQT